MEHDVKDMLEIAIANNDSLWEVTVIDKLQDELERLYSQEAKAKAWDAMKKDFEDIADTPMGQQILFTMSTIKERVESGEYDAKK